MLYSVTVKNGERRHTFPACPSYAVTTIPPDSEAATREEGRYESGVYVELMYDRPKESIFIVLPRDGEAVFIDNAETGKWLKSYKWPIPGAEVAA